MIDGRERESAQIEESLRLRRALLITGDAGLGKSVLMRAAVERVRRAGDTVLHARGYQGEAGLAYATLHQLLRPVLDRAEALPALRSAFAMDFEETAPEPTAVRDATLTLVTGPGRVLIVVDDVQWCDHASLEVIASAASIVAVLAATRGGAPPSFATGFATLALGPLPADAAERLLSLQPSPPAGPRRRRLLHQAGGNPLAIIELAKLADPLWAGTVPVTERLLRLYEAQLLELPRATRDLLMLMASDERFDLPAAAETPGLTRRDERGRPAFRYPVIRSAVYQAASLTARRTAHLTLAAALGHDPDRRAWHLGAAAAGTDEETAAQLEAAGERAARRGAPAEALIAMERAAQLSPDGRARAGRLAKAAGLALHHEQVGKVERYIATVAALTDDPGVLARLQPLVGWVISNTGRQEAAMALLIPAAEAVAGHAPMAAMAILRTACDVALHSGLRTHREQIRRALAAIAVPDEPDDPLPFWVSATADPLAAHKDIQAAVERDRISPDPAFGNRLTLGMLAALGDLPGPAIDVLAPLIDPDGEPALPDSNSAYLTFYGFACLDAGLWDKAESVAGHAVRISAATNPGLSTAMAQALLATLAALRGRAEEGRALAHRSLTSTDPQSRIVTVRCERALGLAAAAEGGHEAAYNHFRRLFTGDGEPVHDHHSYYALVDLASAAAFTGHLDEAQLVLDTADADLAGRPTERLSLLVGTARGILAVSDEDAERHFEAALADPSGDQWPFERARTRLEYGQRLRRRHQIGRAREELTAALDAFERLGAEPWAERARIELRAAGVQPEGGLLNLLTAQELQIVRLAGQGLTNKEIGERLFLSHRTVSTHLYRIFPKLGVSTRAQLHAFADELGHHGGQMTQDPPAGNP
ncbi:LuxR C-terminal-related transcriptional regulator [Streptosporangium sp. NPDC051022]|uniref:LuxR C-terminal-related transcriptional regulator n=1 Tax=Streptosporangium sp. NPDC051022 TaxID=3155752 RepID=UPI0034426906